MVDGGSHPNPSTAAEGYRLRVLAIGETSAEVIQWIFTECLDGTVANTQRIGMR